MVTGVTLTFDSTVTSRSIPVSIVNDGIVEGDQYFFCNLSNPEGPVIFSPAQATVTIEEDATDRKYQFCILSEFHIYTYWLYKLSFLLMPLDVVIGFDSESYFVSEDAGTTAIPVRVLSGELQTQVSPQFFTSSGTAVGKLLS